jgi:hypothetical protein
MNVQELRKIPKAVLIWKLGSNSDLDIITLVPITAPVQRWINSGFDFLIMPATVVWFAPRYVEHKDGGGFEFPLFSELDPLDKGYVNISVQQVTSVTDFMDTEIIQGYLAAIPEAIKLPKVV